MSDSGKLRSLEETPTWSVAVVCFILVIISIFIEHLIHLLGKYLMKNNKRSLYESFEKVKAELMLLGFISLLLTVIQNPISEICVSEKVANSWHPCKNPKHTTKQSSPEPNSSPPGRKLLGTDVVGHSVRRILAAGKDKCAEKGKVALMSTYAIHQLHIFIFVLAVCHVLYCIITMILGRLKIKKWKAWETETRTVEFQFLHDPERFRFARETSFGRRHLNFWSRSPVLIWIVCFFRQLITSVTKVDYMTLRHGFIMAHLAPQSSTNFNFLRYIKKSLEDDFQVVVGISPLIWFFAVLFLLFNTQGWFSYFWLPFIPLVILLLVGTKLQVIITRMALQIMEQGDVVKGVPVVQPTDDLFWFKRPKLLLHLIHFVLFENAFQLAFFLFSWYKFGLHSCFHEETEDILIRIIMGVITQILCSYVTLPLYALVTQMGSNMKPVIFNDRVATALKHWHATAKRHLKENRKSGTVTPSTSQPTTPSHGYSPVPLLHRFQSHLSDDNTIVDSRNATPKNYTYDNGRFDPDESGYPAEGGSGTSRHKLRRGKYKADESVDGDQLDVVGVGIGGGIGSPRHVMPSIQISEEDRKQIAINFSFDKRMLEEGKQ